MHRESLLVVTNRCELLLFACLDAILTRTSLDRYNSEQNRLVLDMPKQKWAGAVAEPAWVPKELTAR